MTDNVIWGTDFRARLASVWDSIPPAPAVMPCSQSFLEAISEYWPDTAPSEYTAPTDDCA